MHIIVTITEYYCPNYFLENLLVTPIAGINGSSEAEIYWKFIFSMFDPSPPPFSNNLGINVEK